MMCTTLFELLRMRTGALKAASEAVQRNRIDVAAVGAEKGLGFIKVRIEATFEPHRCVVVSVFA